jgi:hypothetical protein
MGDWKVLRRILELVIRKEDATSWAFVDNYWNEFKNATPRARVQK